MKADNDGRGRNPKTRNAKQRTDVQQIVSSARKSVEVEAAEIKSPRKVTKKKTLQARKDSGPA